MPTNFRHGLSLLTALWLFQGSWAQTSTVNGQAVYQGTAVATNANGIPTLAYNCARMPAICENVNRRNPLQPEGAGYGALQGVAYVELNFDTNESRRNQRRGAVCPNNWSKNHPCPETNPPQPVTVKAGLTVSSGWTPMRYNPNNLLMGAAGYNRIADPTGANSNIIWSCDEWPPASTVEGGQGQAQSYCAPQSASCAGGGVVQRSEQDWQASAHAALRRRLDAATFNPNGVYTFHFKTIYNDDQTLAAAYVEYFSDPNEGSGFFEQIFKRSSTPNHVMVEEFYANGTSSVRQRHLTEEERDALKRRKRSVTPVNNQNATTGRVVVQQAFQNLPKAPLLPFVDIARIFLRQQAKMPVLPYFEQVAGFVNRTRDALSGVFGPHPRPSKRQSTTNEGQCSPSSPRPDGSCCNINGGCGYGPANCGAGNCTSNCNATALCGRDSLNGNVSCPLNVCCSYYGYCGTDADFCSSLNPSAPCQQGFGSCEIVAAPSCSGDSALARSIAYYQIGNVRDRECNRITPSQINTTGLTHLNLAFASIDPTTFEVVPADAADVDIYPEFTALKSSSLETWIAIGGWDFNDAGSTQSTWSDLASTAASRSAFISSVQSFMSQYGLQGVDIDWEYPGAPDRYGQPQDTEDFVTLLQEMRAAFGSSYGISVTLPASYWYLRWFDPIAMQPYVDFFGLMTYDLHGPWDAEVKQIGQIVYGQTNIPEIYNWTLPLWYDGLDPSKINFGLAYYGRGYTLKDENCNTIGCGWSGPSRPGPCTNFAGIMSLQELESIVIPSLGIQPTLLETDMMKQLTWGDQWIGYDDMETIAMKKQWASSHCYGGTMIWSIDLYSGPGSGNTPDGLGSSVTGDPAAGGGQDGSSESSNSSAIVYIDPSIWQESEPVINCQPPCTFILPPLVLPTPTTITFPLYTTSLDVAWSESTGWTSIVQTTTLTIPPLTTTAIEVWEYTVTDASTNTGTKVISSFYVTSSVRPPPFTITDDPNPLSISGVSHPPVTRTITPPPYPYLFTTPDTPATTATTATTTTSTSTSTVAAAIFPRVTYKPGPDGPICKKGCGFPCLIFCEYPCLICPDGGNDFGDPINPNPPPRPTPSPVEDPIPSGPTVTPPPDPSGTAPADPEEEDLDQECALEFSLPLPTYRGTIGQTTTSVSIATPPPAPSPSPPPPPAPPAPNPATESYHCYDSGSWISRAAAIQAIDNFCNTWDGTVLDASQPNTLRTLTSYSYEDCIGDLDACFVQTIVSVTVINGCRFTMDGPSPDQDCGRILREPVDKCNTASTQFKQGGTVTSNCAEWRIDPGVYW